MKGMPWKKASRKTDDHAIAKEHARLVEQLAAESATMETPVHEDNLSKKLFSMESLLERKDIEIDELEQRISGLESIVMGAAPPQNDLSEMEKRLETVVAKVAAIEDDLGHQKRALESGKALAETDIGKVITSNTELAKNMLEKLKEFGDKMTVIVKRLEMDELKLNFSETLNTLATTQNEERTAKLLSDLRGYIVELKRGGIWNQNLEEVTESLLSEISEMWKSYGYQHLADTFTAEAERLRTE